MRRPFFYALILSLALCVAPLPPLEAHPHVFITSTLDLCFAAGRPTRLDVTWTFDDGFSAMILTDYDTDHDGRFSKKEHKVLRAEAFDYLSEQHYFTFITHGGIKNHPVPVSSFRCEAEGGLITYRFSIPLEPRPGKGATLRLSQYDPTNYSALFLADGHPVTLSGDVPEGVTVTIRENPEETYYFGMLHPIEAVIASGAPKARP